MQTLCSKLITDESGMILSAELVLILTIAVLGMVTGLASVQQAVVFELTDLGMAFSALNQSYSTTSYFGGRKWCNGSLKSFAAGSSFIDIYDGSGGINALGLAGTSGTAIYGTSEIGVGTSRREIQQDCPTPTPDAPKAVPVDDTCKVCPPGSEVSNPTPTPTPIPTAAPNGN